MINKHCDLIYYNSLKQSKAKAKLYLLTNNYFKFLFQIQKYFLNLFKNDFAILNNNAKKIDNKVVFPKGRRWRTPCVNNSEGRKIVKARKGLKPLVIRNKDTKNINNNAALAHCVHLQIGCKSKTDLLSTSINSDNLSEKIKNLRFVINNFNLIKEDIHMRISKKFLTIILSISLLFLVSCGDRPTGSNPVNIDEIINSIPTTEGKPPATDLNVEAVYTGKLTGSYTTIEGEESYSGEIQGGTEFILAITNNFIHFGFISENGEPPTKTTIIVLTNAQLHKDGSLYIAGKNEEGIGSFGIEEEQLPCKNICYIEFTKSGDNTEIKRAIDATSYKDKNFVNKLEYKGTLTKDTSSGSSGS